MAVESPALLIMIEATFRMYRPLAEETKVLWTSRNDLMIQR